MKNRRVLLCDLDGVIFDSYDLWDNVVESLCQQYGVANNMTLRQRLWDLPMSEIDGYLANYFGVPEESERVRQDKMKLARALYEEVPLKKGVHRFLAWAKSMGYPIIAATANDYELARTGLIKAGVMDYFSAVYSTVEMNKDEKDCEYLAMICRLESFLPEQAVLIEDNVNNLRYAERLGMRGIYIKNDVYPISNRKQFVVVERLNEIPHYLLASANV